MTWLAPASFSISADTSPVWAPLALAWQFWPPTRSPLPRAASAIAATSVDGGQTSNSRSLQPACFTPAATSLTSARASARRPFIFQFPAISGRLVRAIEFPTSFVAYLAAVAFAVKGRLVACPWGGC